MLRFISVVALLALAACAVPLPSEPGPNPPVDARDQAMTPAPTTAPAPPTQSPPVAVAQATAPAIPKAPRSAPAVIAAGAPPPIPDTLDSQPVEELIIKPGSVTGFWRLTSSRTIDVDIGLFSGIHIRYGGEARDRNICWLQQKGTSFDAICASGNALKSASGSVDDEGLTMRWWVGAATIIFSGKFTEAEKISGGFSGGVVGVSVTGDVPATLTKLPTPAPSDGAERPSAALVRLVWEDVRRGTLTEGRYEGSGVKRVNQGLSKEMAAETPQRMIYLGEILIRWRKEQRETLQDVYLVQTGAGRRLCRVSANPQGQVIDFNCLGLPD